MCAIAKNEGKRKMVKGIILRCVKKYQKDIFKLIDQLAVLENRHIRA
jgi:hypothetical protein